MVRIERPGLLLWDKRSNCGAGPKHRSGKISGSVNCGLLKWSLPTSVAEPAGS